MMDDYSQFALPEEERRRLLLSNLMMGLGAGLLDSRGRNVWPSISTGLLGGMQMGQQALANAQQGMVARYKLQREVDADNEKKRLAAAQAGANKEIGDLINAPDVEPAKKFEIYTKAANIAAMNNDKEKADYFGKLADKFRPRYSATPHTVLDASGKPVLAQTSEYDAPRVLSGFSPKPEISWQDTGGSLVARDALTTQPGTVVPKTLTPANEQQQRQWEQEQALRVRADQRAAQSAALVQDNAARGEPWQNDLERGIQINPRTGESRPITAGGAPVGAKGASKQAEQSKKALDIISEAEKIVDKSTGSYLGAGFDQAARVFGASTEGADTSAQLQAIEGALMLNQPRMEGPQSDKDTALYKQMAAKIGDPTVPNSQKKAALTVVKKLHQKYTSGVSAGGATGGWSIQEVK